MATVTEDVTIEIIGEHRRAAGQDVHDLKTHIMEMEDRTTERFDNIDNQLAKIMDHSGIQ